MFNWNSIPLWGAGLSPILALFLLGVLASPLVWLGGKGYRSWRRRHPRPTPTTMREAEELARKHGLL